MGKGLLEIVSFEMPAVSVWTITRVESRRQRILNFRR